MNEVQEVLRKVPRAKTPGPNLLPYEICRALPGPAALDIKSLCSIFNHPKNIKIQKVHFETNNSFQVFLIYGNQNLVVKVLQV